MVPAAIARRATVLRETAPQGALASCLEGVCPDTNDAETGARAGSHLPRLEEEVEPAPGPTRCAGAFSKKTGPADSFLQPVEEFVEPPRVGAPVIHGGEP